MEASGGDIEVELADRNAEAADTEVTETQDPESSEYALCQVSRGQSSIERKARATIATSEHGTGSAGAALLFLCYRGTVAAGFKLLDLRAVTCCRQ